MTISLNAEAITNLVKTEIARYVSRRIALINNGEYDFDESEPRHDMILPIYGTLQIVPSADHDDEGEYDAILSATVELGHYLRPGDAILGDKVVSSTLQLDLSSKGMWHNTLTLHKIVA